MPRRASCRFFIPLALLALAPLTGLAQTSTFNLPAQPLADSLKAVGAQTGVNIMVSAPLVDGKQAPPLKANLSAKEALGRLLAGTKLDYHFVDEQTVVIRDKTAVAAVSDSPAAQPVASQSQDTKEAGKNSSQDFRVAQVDQAAPGVKIAQRAEESTQLQEVVVTAQKRTERAQDVPISVVALSAEELAQRNITTLDDLAAAVPSLSINSQGSYNRRIFLRGISNLAGIGNTALIGMYLDEADVTSGAFAQLDLRTYDLERVEVLRGPQGTLYGDGSAGGTIRFITRNPRLDSFAMSADVAALFTQDGAPGQRIESMINIPLIDQQLGIRVAGTFDHEGGWIKQPAANQKDINGSNLSDVRVKALWQPAPQFSANLMALIHRNDAGINYGEDVNGNFTQVFGLTTTPAAEDDYNLYNLTLTYDFAAARLLSATTYSSQDQEQSNASSTFQLTPPGTPTTDVYNPTESFKTRNVNEEVRLTSVGDGPLKWTIGGFYRDFQFNGDQPQFYYGTEGPAGTPLPTPFPNVFDTSSKAWAVFGDLSYTIAKRLTLGAGARYFHDREGYVQYPAPMPQEGTFHATSPRFYLDYELIDQINVYASAAKGFRSGGFNSFGTPSYAPENIWTYELGVKTSFPAQRIAANADVFYTDYKGYQIFGILAPPQPPIDVTSNGGSARVKGVEWDVQWMPFDQWTLSVSGDYADARFYEVKVTSAAYNVGDPLDYFPRYAFTVAAQRAFAWNEKSGFVRLDYEQQGPETYRNRNISGPTPWYYGKTDILHMLNFNARLQWNPNLSFGIFAQNLLNERGLIQPYSTNTTVTESDVETRPRPRTVGVGFGVTF